MIGVLAADAGVVVAGIKRGSFLPTCLFFPVSVVLANTLIHSIMRVLFVGRSVAAVGLVMAIGMVVLVGGCWLADVGVVSLI